MHQLQAGLLSFSVRTMENLAAFENVSLLSSYMKSNKGEINSLHPQESATDSENTQYCTNTAESFEISYRESPLYQLKISLSCIQLECIDLSFRKKKKLKSNQALLNFQDYQHGISTTEGKIGCASTGEKCFSLCSAGFCTSLLQGL